ncbi:MAG: nucleotidyltransferase domain-containing protein [bacterium]
MDQSEVVEKINAFKNLLIQRFAISKIILFGSFIKNTAHEFSDIDVAVICTGLNDDYISSQAAIYKLRRDIDYRIEPHLFIGEEDPSGFLSEILKTGKVIYSAN